MQTPTSVAWPSGDTSRIPFAVYTDPDLHRKELERFFYQGHWCYVGLEAEVPKPGDFKRTVVGERSVIMVRDASGIQVVEMERCGLNARCCGGGGGRMWFDDAPNQRVGRGRVEEIVGSGAETVAVSCPFCLIMVGDGVAAQQTTMQVRDIADLLAEATLGPEGVAAPPV